MLKIDYLNECEPSKFVEILQDIFEHSAWIAKRAAEFRPFSSLHALHERMVQIVKDASVEEQLALIKAHPNLGTRIQMSQSSVQEQASAGLQNLTADEYESFLTLNTKYMNQFGFPFIMAVRGKTKQEIYAAMTERVTNSQQSEFECALSEIYKIALFRLQDIFVEN